MFKKLIFVCTIIAFSIIGCKVFPPTKDDTIKVISVEKISYDKLNDTIPFFITNECSEISCFQQLTLYSNSEYQPNTTVTNIQWTTDKGIFSGQKLDLNMNPTDNYNISCKVEYLLGTKSQTFLIDFCLKNSNCEDKDPTKSPLEKEMRNEKSESYGGFSICDSLGNIVPLNCDNIDLPMAKILIFP